MKPSQVPNQLPHPPPRRMLPLESRHLYHKDRRGPSRHPHDHLGPSSPANNVSSLNRPNLTPRNKLALPHHMSQRRASFISEAFPVSPLNSGSTANRPQVSPLSGVHPATPELMRNLSSHSPSSHIGRDQVTSFHPGRKNETGQNQESTMDQVNNARISVPNIQLRRPPVTPSHNIRAAQTASPLPQLDCSESQWPITQFTQSGSNLPTVQARQHKQRPSSEKTRPAVDLNHSSQKRRREFEKCADSAKKLCFEGTSSGKVHTANSIVDSSLSTSLVCLPAVGYSSVSEPSHKTTEPAYGQSAFVDLSSTFKPTQSSHASLPSKPCIKMDGQEAFLSSTQNQPVTLSKLSSPLKSGEEKDKVEKPSPLLSPEAPPKSSGSSPPSQSGSHSSAHSHHSPSVLPAKTPSRGHSSAIKPTSKPNSGYQTSFPVERTKTAHSRRPAVIPDDLEELFTPDPISPPHKTAKPKIDEGISKTTSEKSCPSSTLSGSGATLSGSSCHKIQNVTATPHRADKKASSVSPQILCPTVTLERVKLENLRSFSPKDCKLDNRPVTTSSGRPRKDERLKSKKKRTSRERPSETDTSASEQTLVSQCSPELEKQANEAGTKQVTEKDPIDLELDVDLSLALEIDLTLSSQSSEDEPLMSLQEMMEHATKPPDTPEKGAFSEPSTPGHHSSQSKHVLPPTTKTSNYKNNLDQLLKETKSNKRAKEHETKLLTACEENLLIIAEFEEAEENREEGISTEHQEFLQRYSLMSSAIREVPPGEAVFSLEKFGQIFTQDTLQLRQCMVSPKGTAQKTLLWSSPSQLRLHLNSGLFQEAYDCRSPCPTQVSRFLFQMMSVHNERMVSEKMLQALCDIACTAAYQIVKNRSQQFKVWVPSLADVALVLMNMGVAFVTLFPFENLQPPFTEGDLLEDIYIKSESPSSNTEMSYFPEHNLNNILKYLSYSIELCPRVYSDDELLLLLTVVGKVGLDTQLVLQSSVELYPLQSKLVNNIRDWDTMLPRICLALTNLTDDHHNMCLLVQLLPYNTRGKLLRRHLSLSMISKLLDGNCTYRPTEEDIKLSDLRLYLPRMLPSTLLRGIMSSSSKSQKEKEDMYTLDQQAHYLCYSLLTLANEASNFQFFPAHQKEQLLVLCSVLEMNVKCGIIESEKCLYRSKVKDLLARISTKWQMLLQRTRPLNDKLYDYWQPLLADTLTSSQEQEMDNSDDEEQPVVEEDEENEETSGTEENKVIIITKDDEEEGNVTKDEGKETGEDTKPEELEGDETTDDADDTKKATELLNEVIPEVEPQGLQESEVMDVQVEAVNSPCTETVTENMVPTRETSDQVAALI